MTGGVFGPRGFVSGIEDGFFIDRPNREGKDPNEGLEGVGLGVLEENRESFRRTVGLVDGTSDRSGFGEWMVMNGMGRGG